MTEQKPKEDPQHSPKMGWGKLTVIATVLVLVLYFVGGVLVDLAQEHRRANTLAEATQPIHPDPSPEADIAPGAPAEEVEADEPVPAAADGADIYRRVCASCHGVEGAGVPGVFPTLIETEWVTGDPSVATRVVLKGLAGPITVKGEPYNNAMPGWERSLRDDEIAAVLTYVRSSWGNDAPPVETDLVQDLRRRYADRAAPFSARDLGMD